MSSVYFVLMCVVALAAVSVRNVHADDEEEKTKLRESILPILADCSKEFGVTSDEISAAKQTHSSKGLNPCFMACLFKRGKILNEEGHFDTEKATEVLKKLVKDEDHLTKLGGLIEACSSVNEKPVTDGEKGCERAQLLVNCFLESKADLTPLVSI